MSRGPTRNANPARPVRCTAGCRTLVWLKGALPCVADTVFVCAACTTAQLRAEAALVAEKPDEYHEKWAEAAAVDTVCRARRRP